MIQKQAKIDGLIPISVDEVTKMLEKKLKQLDLQKEDKN